MSAYSRRFLSGMVACALLPSVVAGPAWADEDSSDDGVRCEDLHVLALEAVGADSSSPTAMPQGEMSTVIGPALAAIGDRADIKATYVSYKGSAELEDGSPDPYASTVLEGYNRLSQVANRVMMQCPTTKLAVVAKGQAAHGASLFLQQVARGEGAVSPDHIAFAATFADPTRSTDAPLFPGKPGLAAPENWGESFFGIWKSAHDEKKLSEETPEEQAAHDIRPHTATSVSVFADQMPRARGRGLGPERDLVDDFGELSGRVAQFCLEGDFSCSSPQSASLMRMGMNISQASSGDFTKDPLGVTRNLALAVGRTTIDGVSTFAMEDIKGSDLATISPDPNKSLSERLEQASDPRTHPDQHSPLEIALKMGSIGASSMGNYLADVIDPMVIQSFLRSGLSAGANAAIAGASGGWKGGINGAVKGADAGLMKALPVAIAGAAAGIIPGGAAGGTTGGIAGAVQGGTEGATLGAIVGSPGGPGGSAIAGALGGLGDGALKAAAGSGGGAGIGGMLGAGAGAIGAALIPIMVNAGAGALAEGGSAALEGGGHALADAVINSVLTIVMNHIQGSLNVVPPASITPRVQDAFGLLTNEVSVNKDLPEAIWQIRQWDRITNGNGYGTQVVSSAGKSAFGVVTDWIVAAGADLAKNRKAYEKDLAKRREAVKKTTDEYDKDSKDRAVAPEGTGIVLQPTGGAAKIDRKKKLDLATTLGQSFQVLPTNAYVQLANLAATVADPAYPQPNIAQKVFQTGSLGLSSVVIDPVEEITGHRP